MLKYDCGENFATGCVYVCSDGIGDWNLKPHTGHGVGEGREARIPLCADITVTF